MATRGRKAHFLLGLEDNLVKGGLDSGLPAGEALDLALLYAVELHAYQCGSKATADLLTQAAEKGFEGLLSELDASITRVHCDA